MRNVRDHISGDMFDRWSHLGARRLKRLLNSWPEVFRKTVIKNLPVGKIAAEFDASMGRPTIDIPVAIGALILQQLFNLTDEETVEELAFNIGWHYALDVRAGSDLEMTDRTLRSYRKKLIDLNLEEIIFHDVTDALVSAFGVDTSKQRMDSTVFQSHMRNLTRLGTFVETISKFIRELRRMHGDEFRRIRKDTVRKYVDREGEGSFGYRPIETRKRLPEAAKMMHKLLRMFEGRKAEKLESYRLMKRVFEEQCEVDESGKGGGNRIRIKEPKEVGFENVNNPSDPDSTYNGHKGQGYTMQVMESYQEVEHGRKETPDIITHVSINKNTKTDDRALIPALDDVIARGFAPEVVIADTTYGTRKNRDEAAGRGVEIVAPVRSPGTKGGTVLTLEDFELDESGIVVKCPAGEKPASANAMGKKLDARFDRKTCAECALGGRCPVGRRVEKGLNARYLYRYGRVERRKKWLEMQEAEFLEKYRWRAGIEGTFSRLKHYVGLGNLRVRGLRNIEFSAFLKALGLNIVRCAAFAPV